MASSQGSGLGVPDPPWRAALTTSVQDATWRVTDSAKTAKFESLSADDSSSAIVPSRSDLVDSSDEMLASTSATRASYLSVQHAPESRNIVQGDGLFATSRDSGVYMYVR